MPYAPRTVLTTPEAVSRFPKLTAPDHKFSDAGTYSVALIFDPADPEHAAFLDRVESARVASVAAAQAEMKGKAKVKEADSPIRPELDDQQEETGRKVVNFKMSATLTRKDGTTIQRKPDIFDAKGTRLATPPEIWGGSLLRVACEVSSYMVPALGAGISLRLKAVQILELVSGSRNAAGYGFAAKDDGFVAADASPSDTAKTEESGNGDF